MERSGFVTLEKLEIEINHLLKRINVNRGASRDLYNGSFKETFNALVTSDGATVTMDLEQSGGGDLTMQFSDGDKILYCTPACTIELTAGATDDAPQMNYIPQATKVLTKSTTSFPTSAEHIKVGVFLVPTEAYVNTDGCYINQNWNDHVSGVDNMGHLLHLAERSRRDGAYYFSGIGPNGQDDLVATSYFDYVSGTEVYFKSTSGVIYQMHRHAISAKDTSSDDIHVVNWNGDAYHDIHDLTDITDDALGNTINNKYFNLVFWGVGNKTGEYAPIMCNLPIGSYNNLSDAQADLDGYDIFTLPREFNLDSSTGFLICRITVRKAGGNWTHKGTVDLRGQTPATATGGASGVTSPFAYNNFSVFDADDITRILNLDLGSVTTGNTRTLVVPDKDGTIALLDDIGGGETFHPFFLLGS